MYNMHEVCFCNLSIFFMMINPQRKELLRLYIFCFICYVFVINTVLLKSIDKNNIALIYTQLKTKLLGALSLCGYNVMPQCNVTM